MLPCAECHYVCNYATPQIPFEAIEFVVYESLKSALESRGETREAVGQGARGGARGGGDARVSDARGSSGGNSHAEAGAGDAGPAMLAAGALAGGAATLLTMPVDVAKVRRPSFAGF